MPKEKSAYEVGVTDYYDGLPLNCNPYSPDTSQFAWINWRQGWLSAQSKTHRKLEKARG